MVAHHAQHGVGIGRIAREGAEFGRHLGRGRVAHARHDGRERAADGAAFVRIIGDAGRHQQAADVGVAEPERAVAVGELGDLLRRELRHQHRDLEHHGPQPHGMLVGRRVDALGRGILELQQVQRRQIAGRVVEEHVFGARVRGDDRPRDRAGVPVVDGGVVLQPGIGRGPGRVADLLPQIAGLDGLGRLAVEPARQRPVAVLLDGAQEVIRHAHGIVGVLARDREVGLRIPIGVEFRQVERGVAHARKLDHAHDHVGRHRNARGPP